MRRILLTAAIVFTFTPVHAGDLSDSIDRLNETFQEMQTEQMLRNSEQARQQREERDDADRLYFQRQLDTDRRYLEQQMNCIQFPTSCRQ